MGHRADRELAQSLLGGDEREFDRFFREYYPRLYRFVLTRTNGDEDLAEEMAQVTLINAMRALEGYRGDASMFTWLCQICRNELSAQAHFGMPSTPSTRAITRSAHERSPSAGIPAE
jgi:RNA polymerase sigma-70 factor (ECF subfamily)